VCWCAIPRVVHYRHAVLNGYRGFGIPATRLNTFRVSVTRDKEATDGDLFQLWALC